MKDLQITRRGFTLIELLIVVAIIAILAAIAVPNFLEAQVRAKVSRVKADFRTIATAVETYHVDNNHYPPQGPKTSDTWPFLTDYSLVYGGDSPGHAPNNPPIAWHLSTPISYLSDTRSVFKDTFFTDHVQDAQTGAALNNNHSNYNYSGDYYSGFTAIGGSFNEQRALEWRQNSGWHVRSRGPDRNYQTTGWSNAIHYNNGDIGTPPGINAYYDASNGTIGSGDIVRFGKGGQK